MYFPLSSLVVGCVCVCSLCSTQRENLCCVPRPLLYVLTQEEEEGGAGGSVWVDWPTHTEEREERAGVDVEEKINGSGGGATPPSCPVSHDECCPVEIYGCQSPPLGTALHRKRQNSLSFSFLPTTLLLMKSLLFPSSLIGSSIPRMTSLCCWAISNDFKIIRRE